MVDLVAGAKILHDRLAAAREEEELPPPTGEEEPWEAEQRTGVTGRVGAWVGFLRRRGPA